MKKLAFIIVFFSLQKFSYGIEQDIPHYKIYSQTPIVNYKDDILDFYSVKNAYGEFSNFALFPIFIDNKMWPSSEHYFQAQKFLDPKLKERVRLAKTPFEAATIGRDKNLAHREDWYEVRDHYMFVALWAKFRQYPILSKLLQSTNNSSLYEHTKNDCYWADCGDRTGINRLGQMLEDIRSLLKIYKY